MKRIIEIEFYDRFEKVTFYTIRFQGEKTEFDKFLDTFDIPELQDQMDIFLADFEYIGNHGASERNLRYEGNRKDNLAALPSHWVSCDLRCFCLQLSEDVVIVGNGYKKLSNAYNTDPIALDHALTLQKVDQQLAKNLKSLDTTVYQGQIMGKCSYTIYYDQAK